MSARHLSVTLLACLLFPLAASSAERPATALVALRPTADAKFEATQLDQLAEGQRLRGLAENALEAVSGSQLLRHAELRKELGAGYLVDIFECRSEPRCVSQVTKKLRQKGIDRVLVGDWTTEADRVVLRFRLIDIVQAKVVDELGFTSTLSELATLPPWREALQKLFDDTGSIELVSNMPGAACTVDGRPCELGEGNIISSLREGEHVFELSKEGYRPAVRTVKVRRGKTDRVAIALEQLPIQLQPAPDPGTRTPPPQTGEAPFRVQPFGLLSLLILVDNNNAGDFDDSVAAPPNTRTYSWHTSLHPMPSVMGMIASANKLAAGWKFNAVMMGEWIREAPLRIRFAYLEAVQENWGFKATFGYARSIVGILTAGSMTLPLLTGDLQFLTLGATFTQSFGPVVIEAFIGKPISALSLNPFAESSATLPNGAARIAYVNRNLMGTLYNSPFPLTISVSGMIGLERLGAGEAAAAQALQPGAPVPKIEELMTWVGSAELFIPFGKWGSVTGEAYIGQGVGAFAGAIGQGSLIDLNTGLHHSLRSAGGWGQLAVRFLEYFEVRALGCVDRVIEGLGLGVRLSGAPRIERNEFYALSLSFYPMQTVSLGLQAHMRITRYQTLGPSELLGGVFFTRVSF